jgi:o-succinylbenzoate synthase
MYNASFYPYQLKFKEPGGTSRGVLTTKMSYIIHIWEDENSEVIGVGECSVLPGLSPDDRPDLEEKLQWCCRHINHLSEVFHHELKEWPAIRFALEMAFLDLKNGGRQVYFESDFIKSRLSIPINGLIWMGRIEEMSRRIEHKLADGFNCLKLKIGALDFEAEYQLLQTLRQRFSRETLEIRVDANGAFSPAEAPGRLELLSRLQLHSIEQPVKAGQWQVMADLCRRTPLPIALDEELIGLHDDAFRSQMLELIRPQYIILKPSLTGGFASSERWIELAQTVKSEWWVTSALESNVGLNAIAQWTAVLNNPRHQGLGTGQVFTNNFKSSLSIRKGCLVYGK